MTTEQTMHDSDITIDAVLTWVDGNDKKWQQKCNAHSKVKKQFNQKDLVRYNSIGEIDIAIKSLIKFAPFLRTIFLITDDQQPESFDELKQLAEDNDIQLKLIDHQIIFKDYESYLPSFNSISIENMMFRIPDLSEHFIYLNDDFFLMRETKASDFFVDGKPIIRGKWENFHENRPFRKLYHALAKKKEKISSFKKVQQSSAKLAGTKRYVRRFHTPVAMRKSTITAYFDKHKNILEENIQYRFRHKSQFLITSLAEHLEIEQDTYSYQRNTQLCYFRSYKSFSLAKLKLKLFIKNKNMLFLTCQSLEGANNEIQTYILKWIEKRLSDQ